METRSVQGQKDERATEEHLFTMFKSRVTSHGDFPYERVIAAGRSVALPRIRKFCSAECLDAYWIGSASPAIWKGSGSEEMTGHSGDIESRYIRYSTYWKPGTRYLFCASPELARLP